MAVQDIIVALDTSNNITYSSTSTDNTITLTDDAFGIFHAIKNLTDAINHLTKRLNK